MNTSIGNLKAVLGGLPAPQRAEIVRFLLESLEPEEEGAAEAWRAELARRMSGIRSGQAIGKPVEDVLEEMRKIYP